MLLASYEPAKTVTGRAKLYVHTISALVFAIVKMAERSSQATKPPFCQSFLLATPLLVPFGESDFYPSARWMRGS